MSAPLSADPIAAEASRSTTLPHIPDPIAATVAEGAS